MESLFAWLIARLGKQRYQTSSIQTNADILLDLNGKYYATSMK
jgi:hypothetical protein